MAAEQVDPAAGTSAKFPQKGHKGEDFEYPFCRDVAVVYEKLAKIGQGTFG